MTSDDEKMTVVFNRQPVIQYDRRKPLMNQQIQCLDRMDRHLDRGVGASTNPMVTPNELERARLSMELIFDEAYTKQAQISLNDLRVAPNAMH